jgi:hypothetical protein
MSSLPHDLHKVRAPDGVPGTEKPARTRAECERVGDFTKRFKVSFLEHLDDTIAQLPKEQARAHAAAREQIALVLILERVVARELYGLQELVPDALASRVVRDACGLDHEHIAWPYYGRQTRRRPDGKPLHAEESKWVLQVWGFHSSECRATNERVLCDIRFQKHRCAVEGHVAIHCVVQVTENRA